MCTRRKYGEESDHGCVMRELYERVLLGKILDGGVTVSCGRAEGCSIDVLLTSWTGTWPAFAASRIWATRGWDCRWSGVYVWRVAAKVRNAFTSANWGAVKACEG